MTRARTTTLVVLALAALLLPASVATAQPTEDTVGATPAFQCVPVPAGHCFSVKGKGSTGVILVVAPDTRGPQESYSTHWNADDRPCRHDENVDGDWTWWTPPLTEGIWVCHHRPERE
ncbi:MAG: hypothetical protein ACLGIR_08415 [Actinomycetes bacterium]